jgi:hypothetical protein
VHVRHGAVSSDEPRCTARAVARAASATAVLLALLRGGPFAWEPSLGARDGDVALVGYRLGAAGPREQIHGDRTHAWM